MKRRSNKRTASKRRQPAARKFSMCRNYNKSKCAVNDKCSWRRNTGCIMGHGKSKRKLSKEIKAFAKNGALKKFSSIVEKAIVNLSPEQKNKGLLLIEDIKEDLIKAVQSPKMIQDAKEAIKNVSKKTGSPKVDSIIKKIANASILMLEDIKTDKEKGLRRSTRIRKPNPKYS